MNKIITILAVGAMGYTGFQMYKKFNPDYKRDVKKYVDTMAKKVSNMTEDMM